MIHRLGTLQEVLDTLTFAEQGFSIMIYKKLVQNFDDARKMVTSVDPTGQTIALLTPCFIENQNWQLQEQSVASYNFNIRYLRGNCRILSVENKIVTIFIVYFN